MNERQRIETIGWLENNQINGAFKGHEEDDMEFQNLDDEVLEWYYWSWVLPSQLEESKQ